jgi:ParB-like chromosome segregation protein Spo0J
VQPGEITWLDEFTLRETGLNKAHIRILAQTVKNNGRLDRVLLWQDERDPANLRLVLLDGAHRLAAYRSVQRQGRGHNRGIPAMIVECDAKTAHLLALAGNTKDSLPLTATERANAAWRLVMHSTIKFSKAEIARAAGVAPRTVANMRRRFKEMAETGEKPSGTWWKDRQGNHEDNPFEYTDEELAAKVAAVTTALQVALGRWKRIPEEALALGLQNVFGHKLRGIVSFLYDEDEFSIAVEVETGTLSNSAF